MRSPILRILLILGLVVSLLFNVVAYKKYRNNRPIMSINGDTFTEKDFVEYLKAQAGPTVKAAIAERILVKQEAKKQGVLPTDAEVEEEYNHQKEINWQLARKVMNNPWLASEAKESIRLDLARTRLRIKGIQVTDEEIKDEYNRAAALYDTPNKAHVELAAVVDPSVTNDVKQLLEKQVAPQVIMEQFKQKVVFLGDNNTFTIQQPLGYPKIFADIFAMKPNEVKVFQATNDLARMGARQMVIRMKDIVPGSKANLSDPKTKEKISTRLALQRGKPWQEVLSGIWANTKFEAEDPNDKRLVEAVLFPGRVNGQ